MKEKVPNSYHNHRHSRQEDQYQWLFSCERCQEHLYTHPRRNIKTKEDMLKRWKGKWKGKKGAEGNVITCRK